MLKQIQITRTTKSVQVKVIRQGSPLSARLIRRGSISTFADLLVDDCETCDDLATFAMTTIAHQLPPGLYDLVIKSGDCICGEFPVNIPKCSVGKPSTCEGDTVCLPPRECILPEEVCVEDQSICDIWNPPCGNKVGELATELDWRITARDL